MVTYQVMRDNDTNTYGLPIAAHENDKFIVAWPNNMRVVWIFHDGKWMLESDLTQE